ncbi:MAG: hypothetical protein NWF01_07930 [Candidatus Bathyarchaeota archaeon]|nr:hypothetical protein [Candidatus Bathyarchaeota archaeon]
MITAKVIGFFIVTDKIFARSTLKSFIQQTLSQLQTKPLSMITSKPPSPERQKIAKIFYDHIQKAIAELGSGYEVTLQGKFDITPIKIEIEINSKEEIP